MSRSLAAARRCRSLPWRAPALRRRTRSPDNRPAVPPPRRRIRLSHRGKRGARPASRAASTPVVPAGEAHAEVTVPLTYNGEHPPAAPAAAPRRFRARSQPRRLPPQPRQPRRVPPPAPRHAPQPEVSLRASARPIRHRIRTAFPPHRPLLLQNLRQAEPAEALQSVVGAIVLPQPIQ